MKTTHTLFIVRTWTWLELTGVGQIVNVLDAPVNLLLLVAAVHLVLPAEFFAVVVLLQLIVDLRCKLFAIALSAEAQFGLENNL